jgi:hypothetical protein
VVGPVRRPLNVIGYRVNDELNEMRGIRHRDSCRRLNTWVRKEIGHNLVMPGASSGE